jgi:hypothetical protein
MKNYNSFLLSIVFGVMWLSNIMGATDIAVNLEEISQRAAQSKNNSKIDNDNLVGNTLRSIQKYISGADTNDWATPSSERLRRIGEVGNALEPHTSLLIDLGTPTETQQGNANALGLLYFAKPSEQLQQQLLNLAKVENPRGAARDAYGILINLGLDTPEVRAEIAKLMGTYVDRYETPSAAEVLFGAREWRITEAVPFYVQLLQQEYRNKDELYGMVRLVAESLRGMGAAAAPALPLLKKYLEAMKLEKVDFRDINVIEGAIRAIEGKDPITRLLTVNGSGPVGVEVQPVDVPPASANQSSIPSQSMSPPKSAPSPPLTVALQQPQTSSPWPWAVGLFLLAVFGGVWWKFLRK